MSTLTSNPLSLPQALLTSSTTEEITLGTKAVTSDGREFVYVKAGGTVLVAGTLQQASVRVANHANILVASAAAIGDVAITVTLGATAATANQYANGLMIVNDVDGQGFTYQIKSNPAADSAASLVVTLHDEDALLEALTTSSQVTLVANPYNGVIQNPTTATAAPVGVALVDIAASSFGYLQTHGLVSCLNEGSTAIGLGLAPSGTDAGALATVAATTNQVASAAEAGVDTESNTVFLRL